MLLILARIVSNVARQKELPTPALECDQFEFESPGQNTNYDLQIPVFHEFRLNLGYK